MRPISIELPTPRDDRADDAHDPPDARTAAAFRDAVARASTRPVATPKRDDEPARVRDRAKRARKRSPSSGATTSSDERIAPVERRPQGDLHSTPAATDDVSHPSDVTYNDEHELVLDAAMVEALVALLRGLAGSGLLDPRRVHALLARLASLGPAHDRRKAKTAQVRGVQPS